MDVKKKKPDEKRQKRGRANFSSIRIFFLSPFTSKMSASTN